MKKIVIIGANSYIARNMRMVLEKDYTDSIILSYDCGDTQVDGNKQYTQVNILEPQEVEKIDMRCDVIFMFVGKTGSVEGFDNYSTFIHVNELALLNVLHEYRKQKSHAKIIFPSTRLVYKGKRELLNEGSEKEFKTLYAINKYACEKYLEQYHRVFGVRYCIFRICVPYGTLIPGAYSYGTAEFMLHKAEKGENIPLYGDGEVRRTLIYIEDLCSILMRVMDTKECINDVYNIGGENYSLKEMAEMIANLYGVDVDFVRYPEIAGKIESGDTVFDDSKLQRLIHYKYKKKFSDWIRDMRSDIL